jgi:hypothetical protein
MSHSLSRARHCSSNFSLLRIVSIVRISIQGVRSVFQNPIRCTDPSGTPNQSHNKRRFSERNTQVEFKINMEFEYRYITYSNSITIHFSVLTLRNCRAIRALELPRHVAQESKPFFRLFTITFTIPSDFGDILP